jgi:hypothetical protein
VRILQKCKPETQRNLPITLQIGHAKIRVTPPDLARDIAVAMAKELLCLKLEDKSEICSILEAYQILMIP